MEIRQLEYFLSVSQSGSFTRAAERLYVSQPAVTNAIRSLEEELGILLFDRNQKLATLTAEGKIFAAHVEKVMHGISQTIEEIDAMKNLSGGVLTLGLTPLGGIPIVAACIRSFREKYPEIQWHFIEADTDELCLDLIEDKLDIAILSEKAASSSLEYLAFPAQELAVVSSRQHRFRRQNSVVLMDLVNEPLILPTTKCAYRTQLVALFEEQASLPQIVFESSQIQTIKSLIAMNCGISVLPECLCEHEEELSLATIEPPLYYTPYVAYKSNRHLSHAAGAFLQEVRQMIGEEEHE